MRSEMNIRMGVHLSNSYRIFFRNTALAELLLLRTLAQFTRRAASKVQHACGRRLKRGPDMNLTERT